MSRAARTLLAFLLWLGYGALLGRTALREGPRGLGPARAASVCPARRPVAVERSGLGVACLAAGEARADAVEAGDAVRVEQDAGVERTRMSPARLSLFAVPLDPNRASIEELASLPGIGPALAARIVAARARRPFTTPASLRAVRGIGPKKLARMQPRLLLGRSTARGKRIGRTAEERP